jgi:glycosyltransferase involved in cell wall biosynthesis
MGRPGPPPSLLPHVCFVAPLAWPVLSRDPSLPIVGGAEVQQVILARALARAGHRVSMVCLDFGQPDRTVVDGITVHRAFRPDAGVPVLRFLHPRLTSVWRAMSAADADIYYQRSTSALTGIVAEFCRRAGRHSVYAGASDTDFIPGRQQIRYRRDRWLYERGVALVDRLVAQNRHQVHTCRHNFGREAVLIPSCYEPPPGAGQGAPRDTVLWVGTVHEYKRPELFLELARRLPRRRFVLVGGPGVDDSSGREAYYETVRAEAAALPNVEFTGFLPLAQVEPYFDRARVLVNTSEVEGMPNTFLQAWARGVPTLAFVDTGSRFEGAAPYPVVGQLEEMQAEIERLFESPQCHRETGERCRAYFAQNHAVGTVLARYQRLFERMAA